MQNHKSEKILICVFLLTCFYGGWSQNDNVFIRVKRIIENVSWTYGLHRTISWARGSNFWSKRNQERKRGWNWGFVFYKNKTWIWNKWFTAPVFISMYHRDYFTAQAQNQKQTPPYVLGTCIFLGCAWGLKDNKNNQSNILTLLETVFNLLSYCSTLCVQNIFTCKWTNCTKKLRNASTRVNH